jgi:hypothetical protein
LRAKGVCRVQINETAGSIVFLLVPRESRLAFGASRGRQAGPTAATKRQPRTAKSTLAHSNERTRVSCATVVGAEEIATNVPATFRHRIGKRLELRLRLSTGRFREVFEAVDRHRSASVALKILDSPSAEFVQIYGREHYLSTFGASRPFGSGEIALTVARRFGVREEGASLVAFGWVDALDARVGPRE